MSNTEWQGKARKVDNDYGLNEQQKNKETNFKISNLILFFGLDLQA